MKRVLSLIKGLYDLIASYLLLYVLTFAAVGWVFHFGFDALVGTFGFDTAGAFWRWVERSSGLRPIWARLFLFGGAHATLFWLLRRRTTAISEAAERVVDWLLADFHRFIKRQPRLSKLLSTGFTLSVTLLLVPFVVQPTLVPLHGAARHWVQRTANLLDGSATVAIYESAIAFYRRIGAKPQVYKPEQVAKDLQPAPPGYVPPTHHRMDRWDPLLWKTVHGDLRAFAALKAFMFVESGGQRFAVSRTGCSGLMQFCSRTARSKPFRQIFGVGQVYSCDCQGRCAVPRRVREDLESGELERIVRHKKRFPCELTDARFSPPKSIKAGWRFIGALHREFDGNLHLMYIGYNSGPHVARKLWNKLDRRGSATLDQISRHLVSALEPHFGTSSSRRARSLVRVHLPKITRAYERYLRQGRPYAVQVAAGPRS